MKKFSQVIRGVFALCLLTGMVFFGVSCGKKEDAKEEKSSKKSLVGKSSAKEAKKVEENADPEYDQAMEKTLTAAPKMTKKEIILEVFKDTIRTNDFAMAGALQEVFDSKDGVLSEEDANWLQGKIVDSIEALPREERDAFEDGLEDAVKKPNFQDECVGAMKALLGKLRNASDAVPGEWDDLEK